MNFYSSDFGKLGCDIHLEFQGVEPTNPVKWSDTLKWEAGKGVELGMIKVLKQNGIVAEEYDQDAIESTKIEREGIVISMRFDAVVKEGGAKIKLDRLDIPKQEEVILNEGEILEIKSVNNKNSFDIAEYLAGNPKKNYVGQLAIYLDALGKDRGHLFVSTIDGLHTFWFVCEKIEAGKYKCGNTEVDVYEEYKRFASIWANKDKEPNWHEVEYKVPVETIDWTKLSVSKIGDARNGRLVIGGEDKWKLDYSKFKNLIVSKQGHKLGYSEEESAIIREKTAGFSSKKK